MTKKKVAKDDGDDEESGKDGGTEGANQIKSGCNLNVDGGKKQSGKDGATNGSCEKDISSETEDSKGNVDGVDELGDGDNVNGEKHEKPVPMKIIITVGTVMRLIKEMTVTRGVIWRLVVMKDKQMMS